MNRDFYEDEDDEFYVQRDSRGRLPGYENLLVKFYSKPVKSSLLSQEDGRPRYINMDYVRIKTPHDPSTVIETLVDDVIRDRYEREYEAFKKGQNISVAGQPLADWDQITEASVKELAFFNITTVEELAIAPDSVIEKFGNGVVLRKRAYAALNALKLAEQEAERNAELDALRAEVASMRTQLSKAQAEPDNGYTEAPAASTQVAAKPKTR